MATRAARRGLVVAVSTAALVGALGTLAPAASASGSGNSTVCSAVGAPSTTQTIGVTGVFHVTVFTCADAQASGFQQCANQTVAVPGVAHATVYHCLPPLQFTFGPAGVDQTVIVGGVGGINAGSG